MKTPNRRWHHLTRALQVMFALAAAARASAQSDVLDPFWRYTGSDPRQLFTGVPGESIDLFSGTVHLVNTDLVLPGKAGLDLRVTRSYSSRIWMRTDDANSLIDEKSVLGYGWSFHMGRLKNPAASGGPAGACSSDYPVLELPDGSARVFYAVTGTPGTFVSRDFWKMQANCPLMPAATPGTCIWSTSGVRYEFASANGYLNGFGTPVWPANRIVDRFGNQISVSYVAGGNGAMSSVTDTYGRTLTFSYTSGADGLALSTITANTNVYQFSYTSVVTASGTRRLLTEVKPPAGPSFKYSYDVTAPVSANQYALTSVTYPAGGSVRYTYGSPSFYLGGSTSVPLAAVSSRSVVDRGGGPLGSWSYTYSSPATGTTPTTMSATTVAKPDGRSDSYTFFGFGAVASGSVWKVGLVQQVSLANGAEVQNFTWSASPALTTQTYSAPPYSSACATSSPFDGTVVAALLAQRSVTRDGATYTTTYASFDAYGQPQSVTETGQQTRTTTWTYFAAPTTPTGQMLNLVRGLPATQHVCTGTDCYDNSWTYNGPANALDSQTLTGITKRFTYDSTGNLASVANALGQTLTLGGYVVGNGIPTSLNYGNAFTVQRTASWEGWLLSETNGRGFTTSFTRDGAGRPTLITPPGTSFATAIAYASDGSSTTVTRPAGAISGVSTYTSTTSFDGFSRIAGTSDSEGVLSSEAYDAFGRTSFRSYPYDAVGGAVGDRLDYDGLGRVVTLTKSYRPSSGACDAPGACIVSTTYANNCATTTVQRGTSDSQTTTRCNVSFGDPDERRLVQVTNPDQTVWNYAYSTFGNVVSVGAPLAGGSRTDVFDPVTQLLQSTTTAARGTTTYSWDAAGNAASSTDARGVTTGYSHADPVGLLVAITYRNGQTAASPDDTTLSYDNASNVTGRSSANGGTYSYTYDELNRLTSEVWTAPGGHVYTTSYTYDRMGCLTSMAYPTGFAITMTCDTLNRTKTISRRSDSTWVVNSVTYHPSGKIKGMTYGNGLGTTITYDGHARPTGIQAFASTVLALSYTYDGSDNVRSFNNATVTGSNRTMTYDSLNRLETEIAPSMWGTAAYSYDAIGNRTMSSVGSYTTNFTYDGQTGRLASSTGGQTHPATATFSWDLPGRLASSSDGTTYQYDGSGRRVIKTSGGVATVYHYDIAGRLISETLADGTKVRDYVYLGGSLIAVDGCVSNSPPGCSERNWYHTDAKGSVLARTDAAGNVVARLDYDGFGQVWNPSGVAGSRLHRARAVDSGTGFLVRRTRVYSPAIGRFISPVPSHGAIKHPRKRLMALTRRVGLRPAFLGWGTQIRLRKGPLGAGRRPYRRYEETPEDRPPVSSDGGGGEGDAPDGGYGGDDGGGGDGGSDGGVDDGGGGGGGYDGGGAVDGGGEGDGGSGGDEGWRDLLAYNDLVCDATGLYENCVDACVAAGLGCVITGNIICMETGPAIPACELGALVCCGATTGMCVMYCRDEETKRCTYNPKLPGCNE
jgi:YD repeat-containing protein